MLSEEAVSFSRQVRLAVCLSWVAGFTNAVVLIVSGQTVSHQTGNTTHFGKEMGEGMAGLAGSMADVKLFAFIIAAFWSGALCSGILIGMARQTGRYSRFVLPMCLEALLLSLLVVLLKVGPSPLKSAAALYATVGLSALAMGLQNATITRISGAVVRTTHLTGVFTDLGLETAQLLLHWRGTAVSNGDKRRIALLGGIAASFLAGATLGPFLFFKAGIGAMMLPIVFLCYLVLSSAPPRRAIPVTLPASTEPMLNR